MALIDRITKRMVCVWWPVVGRDGNGNPQYGTPQNLGCFWIDSNVEFVDANGERRVARAEVFLAQDIGIMDVLWLGDAVSGTALLNPPGDTNPWNGYVGAWPVLRLDKTPNIKATKFARQAFL